MLYPSLILSLSKNKQNKNKQNQNNKTSRPTKK